MTPCWLLMATWMGALPSASWQEDKKKKASKRKYLEPSEDHKSSHGKGASVEHAGLQRRTATSRQQRTWPGASLKLPRILKNT